MFPSGSESRSAFGTVRVQVLAAAARVGGDGRVPSAERADGDADSGDAGAGRAREGHVATGDVDRLQAADEGVRVARCRCSPRPTPPGSPSSASVVSVMLSATASQDASLRAICRCCSALKPSAEVAVGRKVAFQLLVPASKTGTNGPRRNRGSGLSRRNSTAKSVPGVGGAAHGDRSVRLQHRVPGEGDVLDGHGVDGSVGAADGGHADDVTADDVGGEVVPAVPGLRCSRAGRG